MKEHFSSPVTPRQRANGRACDGEVRRGTAMGMEQWTIVAAAVVGFLYVAREVVLPLAGACVAAMALAPLMGWLAKIHIPRVLAAVLVVGGFMAVAGLLLAQLEGPAVQWVNRVPEYKQKLYKLSDRLLHTEHQPEAQQGQNPEHPPAQSAAPTADSAATPAANNPAAAPMQFDYRTILAWTGATLSQTLEALVLLFLLLAAEDGFSAKLGHLFPSRHGRHWAEESLSEIQRNISRYLFTISLINLTLGLAVGAGLAWLSFPNALMWGVMAALLNYIPYFGPIVGIIIVAIVSFFNLDSFPKEIWPAGWYLVVHVLEADVFTPIFLGKRFTLEPVMILLWLMFWIWMWGIPGALLAVPFLVSTKVICERTPELSPLCGLLKK